MLRLGAADYKVLFCAEEGEISQINIVSGCSLIVPIETRTSLYLRLCRILETLPLNAGRQV